MNRTWQLAAAAVVGLLIIGLAAIFIGGRQAGVGGPAASPHPTASPTPTPRAATATDSAASVSGYRAARDAICVREATVFRGADGQSGLIAELDGLYDTALTDAERAPKIAALTAIRDESDRQHDQLAALEVPTDAPGLAADHAASLADYQRITDILTEMLTAVEHGRLQDAQALDASTNVLSGRIQAFESNYSLYDCG